MPDKRSATTGAINAAWEIARAAEKVQNFDNLSPNDVARIIDRETGTAEILTALEACAKWIKETADSGDCGCFEPKDVEAWVMAEAIIKKARGGTDAR